ncbi:MAG: glutamate synthase-related protein [Chloroflexota bacterium]
MKNNYSGASAYKRYQITALPAPDIVKWPSLFSVKVKKLGLLKLLLKEIIQYRGKKDVILSRPCLYGVFSGPVGGFIPRSEHCVGCLRCTTEFPEFVAVSHNPKRKLLGDNYFTYNHINSISYEAETGMVPVRGAGYRGKFGGQGWDGMWTDMSEIVRPTRDGIHGREFISTVVDIGSSPNFLNFDGEGNLVGRTSQTFELPIPMIIDKLPDSLGSEKSWRIIAKAAQEVGSLAVIPLGEILQYSLENEHVVPLVKPGEQGVLSGLNQSPRIIEMYGWDEELFRNIKEYNPESLIGLRMAFTESKQLMRYFRKGVRVFHLLADYHGIGRKNMFVLDLIRDAHKTFVDAGVRQEVTLIGGGGIIAAEHIPKAILCGLDAVGLDTPILVALQANFIGENVDRNNSEFRLPSRLSIDWGVQRIKNLLSSWQNQLLEIMGAMGIREVRRLRGEMGRAMFMLDLEEAAFMGVDGYERT